MGRMITTLLMLAYPLQFVQVGEYATRTVELTNKSPVPLFYSISKSMSISSGFLKIPQASLTFIPLRSGRFAIFLFLTSCPLFEIFSRCLPRPTGFGVATSQIHLVLCLSRLPHALSLAEGIHEHIRSHCRRSPQNQFRFAWPKLRSARHCVAYLYVPS